MATVCVGKQAARVSMVNGVSTELVCAIQPRVLAVAVLAQIALFTRSRLQPRVAPTEELALPAPLQRRPMLVSMGTAFVRMQTTRALRASTVKMEIANVPPLHVQTVVARITSANLFLTKT